MDTRNVTHLLEEETTSELIGKLYQVAKSKTTDQRNELLSLAVELTHRGNVNASINGWILYLACLHTRQVSFNLLKRNVNLLINVAYPHWYGKLDKMGWPGADDDRVHSLALRAYSELKKLGAK